jgi:hypothetical protein
MDGVFLAERTILVEFDPVWRVLFVLHCVVVALLAFCASQGDFYSHLAPPDIENLFRPGEAPEAALSLTIRGRLQKAHKKRPEQRYGYHSTLLCAGQVFLLKSLFHG